MKLYETLKFLIIYFVVFPIILIIKEVFYFNLLEYTLLIFLLVGVTTFYFDVYIKPHFENDELQTN